MWRHRAFTLIWGGQTASILGDRVTGIALPWLILLQTRSPFETGLILAIRYLPLMALGLIAGVAADRLDRRILMIAMDVIRAVALAGVAALGALGHAAPLALLVAIVLVLGLGQVGFQVAYRAWLPDVVSDAALIRANSALEASDAAATLAGPLLGGGLIQSIGAALGLGADALSYVISALTLAAIPPSQGRRPHDETDQLSHLSLRPLLREALTGARLIVSSAPQRLLKLAGTPLYLTSGAIELLLATLTQQSLHLPAAAAGVVFGAAGIGGLLGSTLAPRLFERGWQRNLAGAAIVAALGAGGLAGAAHLATLPGFLLAFAANLLLDGAIAFSFIMTGTASTLLTPREIRGRVGAASQMYSSLMRAIGVLVLGAIVARFGVTAAFGLLVIAFIASSLGVARGSMVVMRV